VLGARGHGGVAGLALGSVPGQVAGHARGPLVVVRGQWRPPNRAPGPVVAGADGSAASDGVLRFAFLEAELRRVPLVALCALAAAPGIRGGTRRVEEEFLAVLEPHEKENPEVTVTRRISAGSPRRMLLDAATGAQLLVVGSRGRGGLSGMTVGSVAHAALHHSPCPIAVIPALSPRGADWRLTIHTMMAAPRVRPSSGGWTDHATRRSCSDFSSERAWSVNLRPIPAKNSSTIRQK